MPWINLVIGIFGLLAALALWHWAHLANNFINYTNSLYSAYGIDAHVDNRLDLWFWLAFIVLIMTVVIWLAAFPGLRTKKKAMGWNLLLYASLLNFAYSILLLFTGYGFLNFFGGIIGTVLSFYVLFQIRSQYSDKPAAK